MSTTTNFEEGLAFRQSIPPDLMNLLQAWAMGVGVLPVLSVKALSFAGGVHTGDARRHGLLYLAGVRSGMHLIEELAR